MSQPRILLNAIVKNEILNLPRMLDSTVGHITAAVILDTGSTDGTPEFIKAHCRKHKVPCIVARGSFVDFSQARNHALVAARAYHGAYDYILLMDADMELKVAGPLPELTAECYTLVQKQGGLSYHNARLLKKGSTALYHGVTHEFLAANNQIPLPGTVWWFADHATGSNRGDKYARDVRLLEGYLAEHPGDGRSLFYLAQTYKDIGNYSKAIDLYRQRIAAGGWDEEIWYSQLSIARAFLASGNELEFVFNALRAYNMRPSRAEPIYDLARYYREKKDQQQTAWLFADQGSRIPPSGDFLFVEEWITKWGFTEEKSILGAYNDKTKAIGAFATDKLALMADVPEQTRAGAKRNLFWYLKPLAEHAASFKAVRLPEQNPDKTYINTNPSVALVNDNLKAIVRTVSYRIRPDGTYDYNGVPSIRTTSFLCDFDMKFQVTKTVELSRPTNFGEPVSRDVMDVEDMRLIPYFGKLLASGCVLERNDKWWREQFLMELDPVSGEVRDARIIEPNFVPKAHEKNWMPILDGGELKWMYKPGIVIAQHGGRVVNCSPSIAADFSGGGQCIPFDAGYLAIVHEAQPDPTNGKRYYQHRFVWFDADYRLQKVSLPFVFFDKQIEFAAGLARNPYMGIDGAISSVVVSFGVRDCEAWVGTISDQEVRELVWHS